MKIAAVVLFGVAALAGCGGGGGGGGGDGGQAHGLEARVAPSSVRIPTGAGSGGPLRAVDGFPNLRFSGPTFITHAGDGSNRLFVTARDGRISVFNNDRNTTQATTVLDLTAKVDDSTGESGFFGLAFDPAFKTNGYFYVSYSTITSGARKLRVARYRIDSAGGNVANPNSERVVLDLDHPNGYHFGGWIGFGPDGLLYITHGDGGNEGLVQSTSSLFGKVLRLRVNANGSTSVPADNPFGNAVWALGFRNPWRCSFDRAKTTADGNLWCGDVGQAQREEVNRVRKGANHGWPIFEGSIAYQNQSNRPYADFEPPVYQYDHSVGIAVIGGYVYRGQALPQLAGRYLYSDYATSNLWAIESDSNGQLISHTVAANDLTPIQSFGEDEAGEIYAAAQSGAIYRFEASNASASSAAMPATLSATGLFSDLAALTPAPGLIDYELNSPFWSDGARKQRWLVLPEGQSVGFASDGAWTFPAGTITVKHFELARVGGGTQRVETRVMVNRPEGWVGYTYRWRGDQSDADLLTSGASAAFDTTNPATGAAARVNWTFPSQAQCMNCHTEATGRVLGLNTLQVNRGHSYQSTGIADNQLRTLNHIGVFGQDIGSATQYGALPDPADAAATIESRAKAYLESNCSNCHRPGGPTPTNMDLRFGTAVAGMNIVGVAAQAPTVSGAVRVAPGNHAASDLWRRASSSSATRMPPLGVSLVDEAAVKTLADWIDTVR